MTSKFLAICAVICALQGAIAKPPKPSRGNSGDQGCLIPLVAQYVWNDLMNSQMYAFTAIMTLEHMVLEFQPEIDLADVTSIYQDLTSWSTLIEEDSIEDGFTNGFNMELTTRCILADKDNLVRVGELLGRRYHMIADRSKRLAIQLSEPYLLRAKEEFTKLLQMSFTVLVDLEEFARRHDIIGIKEYVKRTNKLIAKRNENVTKIIFEVKARLPEVNQQATQMLQRTSREVQQALQGILGRIKECREGGKNNSRPEEE